MNSISEHNYQKEILKKTRNFGENCSCRKYVDFSLIFFVFFFEGAVV